MSKFADSKEILLIAFKKSNESGYLPNSMLKDKLEYIINSNEKTYKYILINALVAKAAMPEINPICLQKKSKLLGAYDARSHCHNVIVPFEKEYLEGALGNSNEPFLNKPARAEELSKQNPTRGGDGKKILFLLCDILPTIKDPSYAFHLLVESLFFISKVRESNKDRFTYKEIENSIPNTEIFLNSLLESTYGGETLSLAIGIVMKAFVEGVEGRTRVEVHKVNQSGASSKEISDIDVYLNDAILYTIEVKDKNFSKEDILHAMRKSMEGNAKSLFFISGNKGRFIGDEKDKDIVRNFAKKNNFSLKIMYYKEFISFLLTLTVWSEKNKFIMKYVQEIFSDAQMKDTTIQYVLEKAEEYNVIVK